MSRAAFAVTSPRSAALRALNYLPAVERMRALRGNNSRHTLGSLLRGMGRSYGAVFTRLDCAESHGIELLSQTDMFAVEPEGRRIRLDSLPVPERHEVKHGHILIAGAGTLGDTELYGRAVYAGSRLAGKYVGPDAMVLEFEHMSSDAALFTFAFLCTRLGVSAVRSTSYGTKLLRFRTDLLQSLPVPDPGMPQSATVASLVRRSVAAWDVAAEALRNLRAVVSTLPAVAEANHVSASRGPRAVSWAGPLPTMTAWTFASAGPALAILRKAWRQRMVDVVAPDGIYYGDRFSRIECSEPFGVDFIAQRDVFMVRPVPRRVATVHRDASKLVAGPGTLLVGGHGQMNEGSIFGRVEMSDAGLAEYAVSEDILRIVPAPQQAALCFAILSSPIGLELLRSTAYGTSIPKMRLDLLADLPMPEVDTAISERITASVNAVQQARLEARTAEAEAVRIVEDEVIPLWLS